MCANANSARRWSEESLRNNEHWLPRRPKPCFGLAGRYLLFKTIRAISDQRCKSAAWRRFLFFIIIIFFSPNTLCLADFSALLLKLPFRISYFWALVPAQFDCPEDTSSAVQFTFCFPSALICGRWKRYFEDGRLLIATDYVTELDAESGAAAT